MKKHLTYIALCLITLKAGAQNNYTVVAEKFYRFYNQQTPDSIFFLYSSMLKEKLPLEKTRALFSGMHVEFGELKSLVLVKQDSGFNSYKASFSHQTLSLLLALTNEDLIEGFRLVPFVQEQFPDQTNKSK
jgi:hypothetical protein